jgi:uncharacterized protein YbjT (DUF2867 family)
MKLILAGATGQVGRTLLRDFARENAHELVVLTRDPSAVPDEARLPGVRVLPWDGRTLGPWATEIDGADAVSPDAR